MKQLEPETLPERRAAKYIGMTLDRLKGKRKRGVGPDFIMMPSGRVRYFTRILDEWLNKGYEIDHREFDLHRFRRKQDLVDYIHTTIPLRFYGSITTQRITDWRKGRRGPDYAIAPSGNSVYYKEHVDEWLEARKNGCSKRSQQVRFIPCKFTT